MVPEPGSTNVGSGQPIIFRFSERMDRRSVERALFFTPDIGYMLLPRWRGNELQLIPRTPLRDNTTYVVTLGADAADARRNRLGRSITLAFSTGATLDDAAVAGRVLEKGRAVEGAWIWIYPVGSAREAQLADPRLALPTAQPRILPLYVKQTDDAGRFEASHLAAGAYRVFAFQDRDGNRLYDPERDPLAVPPSDIRFRSIEDRIDHLNLALAPRDTTGPEPRSASAPNRDYVHVGLSEPAAPGTTPRITIEEYMEPPPGAAEEAQAGPLLGVLGGYVPLASPATVVLWTERMVPDRRYRIRLRAAFDEIGNPGRPASRPITFKAPAVEDTTRPARSSVTPADSSRALNRDIRIRLVFTTEIDTTGLPAWSLVGADTIALSRRWLDPRMVELRPEGDPEADAWYALSLPPGTLRSWTGLTGPARGDTIAWQGSRPLGRGTLRIRVEGEPLERGGRYLVMVEGAGSGTTERTLLSLTEPGEVYTPALPEGAYLIWGFADTNGNGRLDPGRVMPFEPAERVDAIADTQYVRDTFESIVASPLDLGGIRHRSPPPAAADSARSIPPVPPPARGVPPRHQPPAPSTA